LSGEKIKKIAGEDLFYWEMNRLQTTENVETPCLTSDVETRHAPSVLFLGSSEEVLAKIKARAANDYPNVEVHTYSAEFTVEDNRAMVEVINKVNPAVLFVGMTAPKQEKWAYRLVNGLLTTDNGNMNKPEEVQLSFQLSVISCQTHWIVMYVALVQYSIFMPKR
jgi:N-acetylglucosaminyldiphosphoundecaprenol N-acetyl-beta-D-mannosaminyltransferase